MVHENCFTRILSKLTPLSPRNIPVIEMHERATRVKRRQPTDKSILITHEVESVKCGERSAKRKVWSAGRDVWNADCEVWNGEWGG